MNEHDVIRYMGRFPDEINPAERLTAKAWRCYACGVLKTFGVAVPNPAPCECGGIGFTVESDVSRPSEGRDGE